MSEETVLESLDSIPEQLHKLFEETDDGGYRVKPFETEDEIAGLKKALETEREKRKRYERSLKEREPGDEVDLDEYRRLKKEAAEREEQKAREAGKWDELREKLKKEHQSELEKVKSQIQQKDEVIKDLTVKRELRMAIEKAGVLDEYRDAVEALMEKRGPTVNWTEDGPQGVFPDELHGARPIVDYLTEWAQSKEAAKFLPPDSKVGGGASGRSGAGGAGKKAFKDMSEKEKMDLADELPPEEYAALVAEAYGG